MMQRANRTPREFDQALECSFSDRKSISSIGLISAIHCLDQPLSLARLSQAAIVCATHNRMCHSPSQALACFDRTVWYDKVA